MRCLIGGSLSFLLLASLNTPASHAQAPSRNPVDSPNPDAPSADNKLTPFNLVTLAYQGYFKDQGIPSGDAFLNAYQGKTITAEALVKTAIATQRLSPDVLNDAEYIAAVENQLEGLTTAINKR